MKLPTTLLGRLEQIDVAAQYPFLRSGPPAVMFKVLRAEVARKAGYDFLGIVDLLRPRGFLSENPNVAGRSRHICGDAFDFDQSDHRIGLVSEPAGNLQFWRVYLKSETRSGKYRRLQTATGEVSGQFIDFTDLAASYGWERVPAWPGWKQNGPASSLRAFWHYQRAGQDLTWAESVDFLYGRHQNNRPVRRSMNDRVLGLNDRGELVTALQVQLATLRLLSDSSVTGTFAVATETAVRTFQEKHARLKVTGECDPATSRQLALDVLGRLARK